MDVVPKTEKNELGFAKRTIIVYNTSVKSGGKR